jgi:RNA polymerase sigma-70 factor (ECF subfamily)
VNVDINEMRPRAMSIACRILKHTADAEDAVQEAFLRLHVAADVTSPEGFLVRTTTRRCIDQLRKHQRRNAHIGRLVSELADSAFAAPHSDSEDHVKHAFQVMLERLTAPERAALFLRKVFNYEYAQIAFVLRKSEGYVRQIVCRAKSKLAEESPRPQTATLEAETLAKKFLVACRDGDLRSIEQMFAEDAPDAFGPAECPLKARGSLQLKR